MTAIHSLIIRISAMLLLLGCSGGGLENDSTTPTPKVLVNIGAAKTVNEQSLVTLSAQASGQTEELSYAWRASPTLAIEQEDPSVGIATFIAPVTTETLTYTITVTVTDSEGNQGSDSAIYTILPVNIPPEAIVQVQQYPGLAKNQFPAGYEVTLNGMQSKDDDPIDENVPIVAYNWQQTAGEEVLNGISTQGDSLAFFTPVLEVASSITISLTVTDAEGAEDTEFVTLTVQSAAETLPEVNAGVDHNVFSGESINLNGQASTTVPAAQPLNYLWLNDSETDPQIEDLNALQTVAVAPAVSSAELITFTLRVTDAQGNRVDDEITVTVRPLPIQPINDTGVIQQATDTQILSAYQADYPGQDGQRGQDIIHQNGLSEKAGRGANGFDFTRLDESGDEVDDEENLWHCVRDNITGLIWEVKTAPTSSDLHSNNATYEWYQILANGEQSGDFSGSNGSCSLNNCQTKALIDQVNQQGLCNFRDWRLPTHNELLSIVHLGQSSGPMIDTDYFPNTANGLTAPIWYWTQNESADGMANGQAHNAWAIDFATGNDNFLNKSTAARVRLVRAGR
ncbi:Lcl domain-containing protein [Paraglaciecola aestuariivivens]